MKYALLPILLAIATEPRRRDGPPETPEERHARLERLDAQEREQRGLKAEREAETEAQRQARVLAWTPEKTLRHRARRGDVAALDELVRRGGA